MKQKDEALKLALEALEVSTDWDVNATGKQLKSMQAITALRKALAQPEQEPVAWADIQKEAQQIVESKFLWKKFIDGTPLSNDIACWMADFAQQYTTTWVGLTDEERSELVTLHHGWNEYGQAIEAKLKEKNT